MSAIGGSEPGGGAPRLSHAPKPVDRAAQQMAPVGHHWLSGQICVFDGALQAGR